MWQQRPRVTLAEGATAPNVALDDSGDAFAVFTKGRWPNTHFQAAVRGGVEAPWQDAVTISSLPETGVLASGKVAVDPTGDAVTVFDRWSGNGYVIQAAVRPGSSGRWEQVVDLSDPNGNSPRGAGVAMDKAGNAVALWARARRSAESPVIVSAFRPANGAWTAPVEVGGPYSDVWELQAAFDLAGNALRGRRVIGSGSRHRAQSRDVGVLLFCRVTATNGALTRAATSRPVQVR